MALLASTMLSTSSILFQASTRFPSPGETLRITSDEPTLLPRSRRRFRGAQYPEITTKIHGSYRPVLATHGWRWSWNLWHPGRYLRWQIRLGSFGSSKSVLFRHAPWDPSTLSFDPLSYCWAEVEDLIGYLMTAEVTTLLAYSHPAPNFGQHSSLNEPGLSLPGLMSVHRVRGYLILGIP